MPIAAMALVVVLLGVFLWLLHRSEQEEEAETLIKDVLWVEQTLHFQIASDEEKLLHLAEQLAGEEGGRSRFDSMARLVVSANPAIERVVWLDAAGHPLLTEPPAGRAEGGAGDGAGDGAGGGAGGGGDPAGRARADAFLIARSSGLRSYGAPYRTAAGGAGFDLVVPMSRDGRFIGALVGVMSLDAMLTHHVPWWVAQRYRIEVVNATGAVLAAKSRVAPPDPRHSHTVPLDRPGHGLALVATLYRTDANMTRIVLLVAIFGLTAAALASLWSLRRHIARRIRAEEALRAEHAFRKAMEDSLTVGMRARDLEGRITYVNPAFCRMVGVPAEELIGRGPPMPYWLPEELEEAEAAFRAVLAGKAPSNGLEMRFRRADGERFDALIYEAPLIDANGRHAGWMGSVLDVTERKRAEELARQQQERLQHTARLITLGEMASTLAHELNQPLSAIASYCTGCLNKLRSDRFEREEVAAALDKLAAQARRAGQIIRRVHEFVRKREPVVAPCSLTRVAEDCVALMGADAARHGVRLELEAAEGLPEVCGDRILLQQVVLNLMRNGIEAMARTPRGDRRLTIAVSAGEAGPGERQAGEPAVRLSVQDRGCGIPPENAASLFTPFFTTKSEGMGMGLNICRSIVEHHRGRLWFEPGEDGGTRFLVSLPVAPVPSASPTSSQIPAPAPTAARPLADAAQ
ncbi:PAS domain-containing sensor histidine kinase [Azospirillum thermophilum]|uniref:histidine kinase n=2 Tax=Azospirillum thermophilum TaxID=2202148 RepID=A0A2S2CTZ9_9PROT|nr:PAS domain-containing sensor histidine kinase [Azospirillum thermophilum]